MLSSRSSVRLVCGVAAAAVCLVLPASSSATVYCVGASACAPGDTGPLTLAAAFTAADNATPDTIKIGAGTFEIESYLDSGPDEPLTVIGSGTGVTILHIADGAGSRGINLADELSSISNLDIDNDDAINDGIANFLGTPISLFSAVPDTGPQAHDLRIYGDGLRGISARGDVRLDRVDIRLPLDSIPTNAFSETYSIPLSRQTHVSAPNAVTRVYDSHIEGAIAASVHESGTFEAQRTKFVYAWRGVDAYANLVNLDVRLANDVFEYKEPPLATSYGALYGVLLQSGTGGAGASDLDAFVWDSTFVTPVYGPIALQASSGSDDVARPADTSLNATGTVLVGDFYRHLRTTESATGGGSAITYAQLVTSRTTTVPVYDQGAGSDLVHPDTSQVLDPKFVDAAAGDYRLQWNSPLVDAGIAGRDPGQVPSWVGTTDFRGETRPVWSTGSTAIDPKDDIGAFEYNRYTPVASAGTTTPSVAPGALVTLTGSATDANPGETATLSYAWTLPGGGTSSAMSANVTAPTAPGTYQAQLVATDVTGAGSVPGTVSFTVVAPTPPVVISPTDTTAPKVTFTKLTTSLPKLLARTALTAKFSLSERATVSSQLVATITLPPLKKGKPVRRIAVVLAANKAVVLQSGKRSTKLTPTKAGIKRFNTLRAMKGAKIVRYDVKLVATDAAKNATRPSLKVTVTKR